MCLRWSHLLTFKNVSNPMNRALGPFSIFLQSCWFMDFRFSPIYTKIIENLSTYSDQPVNRLLTSTGKEHLTEKRLCLACISKTYITFCCAVCTDSCTIPIVKYYSSNTKRKWVLVLHRLGNLADLAGLGSFQAQGLEHLENLEKHAGICIWIGWETATEFPHSTATLLNSLIRSSWWDH